MRVLGIDPGTIHMGYGVVDETDGELTLVDYGVLNAPSGDPIERRLWRMFEGLQELVRDHSPDSMAVEEPFVVRGPRRSALAVGEARAVALLVAAGQNVAVAQYTPTKVRSTVADYGASDKEQIREMVGLLLNRSLNHIALDASDALAVAICHLRHAALDRLIGEQDVEAVGAKRRRNYRA